MRKMKSGISRRDFLKGAAAGAVGIAGAGVLAACSSNSDATTAPASEAATTTAAATDAATTAAASSEAAEATTMADAKDTATTWTGTRYTTFENPDGISWPRAESELARTEEADVVVVGSGLGGFMASMIAKEQMPDKTVIMLEKNGYLGGSTNFAECNGPQNASEEAAALASGIRHASGTGYIADMMLMRDMAIERGMNSAWLFSKHNVKYGKSGPMNFYADGGYDGYGEGSSAIATLEEENKEVGVDIRTENQAIALVMKDEYTCTGIQVHDTAKDEYYQINCKAVVLATGGMANSMGADGVCQYYTSQDVVDKCYGWGAGQQGDGQLMVEQTAHGRSKSMTVVGQFINVRDFAYDSPLGVCVSMQASNLCVNQEGIRFVSEENMVGKLVELQGSVFSIVGSNLLEFWKRGGCNKKISGFADILVGADFSETLKAPFPDKDGKDVFVNVDIDAELEEYADNPEVWKGGTLEELAGAIKADNPIFDTEAFLASVAKYEEACTAAAEAAEDAESCDTDFGKKNSYLVSLGDGPYYAFRLTSGVLNTCGGIRINRNAQVVDPRYNPIEGLFAAGICTSGWDGEIYGGGTCQPVAMFCGSRSARYIVENLLGGKVADDWYGDDPDGYCEPAAAGQGGGPGGGEGGPPPS